MEPDRGHSLPEVFPAMAKPGDAAFSPCGRYRWWLQRTWDPGRATLLFVGLNPSRADAVRDDPTLRRLVAYGRRWGFGRLEVLNLFAWVAPNPGALRCCDEPVGVDNDSWIQRRLSRLRSCGTVSPTDRLPSEGGTAAEHAGQSGSQLWLGWGNGGVWQGRGAWMIAWLAQRNIPALALGRTAAGQPRHPLYCAAAMTLAPFAPSWGQFGDPEQHAHATHSTPLPHPPAARGRP